MQKMNWLKSVLLKVFITLSLSAVLMLFYNDAANWHYHLLQDGTLIRHAHPFSPAGEDNGPFRNHKHNQTDFIFFAQISIISVILALAILLLSPFFHYTGTKITFQSWVIPQGVVAGMPSLRAPPAIG